MIRINQILSVAVDPRVQGRSVRCSDDEAVLPGHGPCCHVNGGP